MILEIVSYGHPVLRAKGRRLETPDAKMSQLALDMLETMHEVNGIGLAAQQIGLPIQLCVIDIAGTDDPGRMWVNGSEVDPEDHMPLVLVNPEVEKIGEPTPFSEGCLSFPGVTGDVDRPPRVRVQARLLNGSDLSFEADGLLARAVQHEHDHLHGVLFIDRMSPEARKSVEADITRLLNRSRRS